jgi:adenylate cyclase
MSNFLSEVKERKLGRTLVVYLGSAWVIVEAVNFFIEKYKLDNVLFNVALILALAGLPVALLIAWFHGKPGDQKVTKMEIALHAGVLVVALILVSRAIMADTTDVRRTASRGDKSIAVLPFQNINKDTENEFISDGITDDIIAKLSQLSEFKVISRTSSFYYKGHTKTLPEIGNALGVTNILEGTVRRSGNQLRITAELIDVMSDESLWVETFDRNVTELFTIQTEVAEQIAKALRVKLSSAEQQRIESNPDFHLDAYEHYQKGLSFTRGGGSQEELDSALAEYNHAVELNPTFTQAYVALAAAYLDYDQWGRKPLTEVVPKARATALKAIELNGNIGEAYYILADCAITYEWDEPKFLEYMKKTLSLSPNFSRGYERFGSYCTLLGDSTNALKNLRKAIALDPMSTRNLASPSFAYVLAQDPAKAIDYCLNQLKTHPANNFVLFGLGQAYAVAGQYEKAIETLERRTAGTYTNWCLGYAYGKAGRKADAEKVLSYLLEKSKSTFVPPIIIGYVYLGLGENEKAMDYFEKILERSAGLDWLGFILWDPRLEELRSNPRFVMMREKIPFGKRV